MILRHEISDVFGVSQLDLITIEGIAQSCNSFNEASDMLDIIFKDRIKEIYRLILQTIMGEKSATRKQPIII